jgi:hypothetical protein
MSKEPEQLDESVLNKDELVSILAESLFFAHISATGQTHGAWRSEGENEKALPVVALKVSRQMMEKASNTPAIWVGRLTGDEMDDLKTFTQLTPVNDEARELMAQWAAEDAAKAN